MPLWPICIYVYWSGRPWSAVLPEYSTGRRDVIILSSWLVCNCGTQQLGMWMWSVYIYIYSLITYHTWSTFPPPANTLSHSLSRTHTYTQAGGTHKEKSAIDSCTCTHTCTFKTQTGIHLKWEKRCERKRVGKKKRQKLSACTLKSKSTQSRNWAQSAAALFSIGATV